MCPILLDAEHLRLTHRLMNASASAIDASISCARPVQSFRNQMSQSLRHEGPRCFNGV